MIGIARNADRHHPGIVIGFIPESASASLWDSFIPDSPPVYPGAFGQPSDFPPLNSPVFNTGERRKSLAVSHFRPNTLLHGLLAFAPVTASLCVIFGDRMAVVLSKSTQMDQKLRLQVMEDKTLNGMGSKEGLSTINSLPLKVPKSFVGVLPVSPCRLNFPFEPYPFLGLSFFVKPGDVVWDVGCSYGVISALAAKLVGRGGHVYGFDANPAVLLSARKLSDQNGLGDRVSLTNFCIGETSNEEVEFYVAPGFRNVSSSRSAGVAKAFKDTRKTKVRMMALDDLMSSVTSKVPNIIKIDIEGGECCVIMGASKLLSRYLPDLVIETHGCAMQSVGGSLERLCSELVERGYELYDLKAGHTISGEAYAMKYRMAGGHLLASSKLQRLETLGALCARHRLEEAIAGRYRNLWRDFRRGRECLSAGFPGLAALLFRRFLGWVPDYGEGHYLLAQALHRSNHQLRESKRAYKAALEHGFDEFSVRYNLGCLYRKLGDPTNAVTQLRRACALRPGHSGPKKTLELLKSFGVVAEHPEPRHDPFVT